MILFVESHLRKKQRSKKYSKKIIFYHKDILNGHTFFERLKRVEFLGYKVFKMFQDARQNIDIPASRADSSL